ncbi:MAG: PAS domain S-box protein [Sneathiella sp.]|nr:PAS domain S-box protein [Sneathiella sp.]
MSIEGARKIAQSGKLNLSNLLPHSIGAKVNLAFAVICTIMIGTLVLSWLAFRELGAQISEFNEVSTPSLSKSIHLLGIANSFYETGPVLANASTTGERRVIYARMVDYLNRMSTVNIAYEKETFDQENRARITRLIERLKTSLTLLNSSAKYRIRLLEFEAEKQILFSADFRRLQKRIADLAETQSPVGLDLVNFDRLAIEFHDLITNWQSVHTKAHIKDRLDAIKISKNKLSKETNIFPVSIASETENLLQHLTIENHLLDLKVKQFEIQENTARELEKVKVKIIQIRLILSLNVKRTERDIEEAAEDARRLIQSRTAQLAIAVFVVVLLAFFASLVFVRRSLVRRLTALGVSMQQIAKGKLNTPINVKGQDEIARMAEALLIFRNTAREVEEQQTRAIIESSVAGLVMTDSQGVIEFLSYTARQLFGYDPVAMPQRRQTIFDLVSQNEHAPLRSLMHSQSSNTPSSLDKSATTIIELPFHRKDGSWFPGDIACRSVIQRSGTKLIFTIYDVSDRKLAQQKLEETVALRTADLQAANLELKQEVETRQNTEIKLRSTKEELVQASKLASLGKMASGISHELNQPLMAVSNWIHNAVLLLEKGNLKTVNKALQDMDIQVNRMIELASHLRTLARQPELSFKAADPCVILDRALALFSLRAAQDGVAVGNKIEKGYFKLETDSLRLEQIFINLISNAFDAMRHSPTQNLEIACQIQDGGTLEITFSDTGPGISDEELPHLFDPFFTTKEVGQGMGLGLSISYNIARTLGGNIHAMNNASLGATFILTLPLKRQSNLSPVQAEEIW